MRNANRTDKKSRSNFKATRKRLNAATEMQQKIAEKKQFQAILTNHKDNGIIKCHNKIEMKDNKRVFYCTLDKK